MRKVVVAGMIGNGLEWYDYALYGHFAVLLSALFFPSENQYVSLIATFGVFAAGFLMRPVGAVLFGFIGDKYGRKSALTISILLMAIPTACIGLLPTYAEIGIWAPVLLTVIRLLQGISLGGEFSGSITYVVEHAPDRHRGLAGSTSMCSLAIGTLLGSIVASLFAHYLPKADLEDWGWRVPFLIGMVIGLVGLYIRNHLHESPKYETAKQEGKLSKTPLRDVLKHHRHAILVGVFTYLTVTMPFYALVVFMVSFMSKVLGHPLEDALFMNTIVMVIIMVLVPLSAHLSDTIGRKKLLSWLCVAYIILIWPAFHLILQPGFMLPLLGHMLFAVLVGCFLGPVPALLVELFPTSVRYTGMALSYNIAGALFGGTSPMVITWLSSATGSNMAGAVYIMIGACITFLVLRTYRDRTFMVLE